MAEDLTPNELALLRVIDSEPRRYGELAGKAEISESAVNHAAALLSEKGLAGLKEELRKNYSLTEEGRRYAEHGLPERRVRDVLPTEGRTIDSLNRELPPKEVSIALGWLRKKHWAAFKPSDEGTLLEPRRAPATPDEEALKVLAGGGTPDEQQFGEAVSDLVKRGLVDVEEGTVRTAAITPQGEKARTELADYAPAQVVQLTPQLLKSGEWKGLEFRPYDVKLSSARTYPAKRHPYRRLITEMRQIFLAMGFTEISGEIVQTQFWNFDALFQPQDHPARDMQDTFYLSTGGELPEGWEKVRDVHQDGGDLRCDGWGYEWDPGQSKKHVLRTHTTAHTIRWLAEHPEPPQRVFCIDRAYRRETIDPTHTPEFEQLEGVVMDRDLGFADLLGLLSEFYREVGFEKVRFRPGYFPYTEPSVEPEVYVEGMGWVELGGAGIFREEVCAPLGIDYPVLAWGLGVSRLAMLRLGLTDLRELYQPDIDWLRREPACRR